MVRSNFGAVRLPLLGAAVLASFAVSLSAQVVEKGRTYADLVATHPCNSGNSGRLARVTDAQSSSSIGGGGGSTQVWAVCDGVSTWTLTSIGSAGGGAATAVTGSATLPATCTEKDLYQDTDSGGTEFYVCTAANTWTKTGTGAGDVVGPASATDNAIVRFDSTTGKLLQDSSATVDDNGRVQTGNGTNGGVNFGGAGARISDSNNDGRLDLYAGGARQADIVDIGGGYRMRYVGTQGISTPKILATDTIVGDQTLGSYDETYNTETLTLSTSGTTTATLANRAPANSIIEAILYRISTTITTATAFDIRVTGGNPFASIGTATTSQTTMTVGTTGILVPVLHADQYNAAATTLTVTTTGTPGAGAIRLTVIYKAFSPATL